MSGSPSVASLFAQRIVIGVGDLTVSNNTQVILSTYALGSCIGVVAYDAAVRAGGILHFMLPDSSISPDKAKNQPAMFADTGLPLFFRSLVGLKADPSRLRLLIAGGASVIGGQDNFRIGERNIGAARDYLSRRGFSGVRADIGGNTNRTLHLELATGLVTMKTPEGTSQHSLA